LRRQESKWSWQSAYQRRGRISTRDVSYVQGKKRDEIVPHSILGAHREALGLCALRLSKAGNGLSQKRNIFVRGPVVTVPASN
jgi:hypothetical protein